MKALALPVCLLGLLTIASADALRDQINSMSAAVGKSLMAKDIVGFAKAIKPGVTADFKYLDNPTAKPMNFDQMVAGMKMGVGSYTKVTVAEARILSVKPAGDSATVLMSHKMAGLITGPDKKSHVQSFTGISIDTYKKVGGAWKMASMTIKSSEMKMDGKPMQMPAGK